MAVGFSCEDLDEPYISGKEGRNFYLNDDRFFYQPDNHLYHPVKSVVKELESLRTKTRKLFLTNFVERLLEIYPATKNFKLEYDTEKYSKILFNPSIQGGGHGISYSAKFIKDKISHQENIHFEMTFSGTFNNAKTFQTVQECRGLEKIQPLYISQTPTSTTIFYILNEIESVNIAANIMKVLIESTYPIFEEKFFVTLEHEK